MSKKKAFSTGLDQFSNSFLFNEFNVELVDDFKFVPAVYF
jgi:hypothetical protein